MDIERKTEDFKSLSRVVPCVDLAALFLHSCNVNRDLDALAYESIEVDMSSSGELLAEQGHGFQAKVSLCLVLHSSDDERKELVRFDSEYILVYKLTAEKKPSTNDIEVFCSMNAVYNVWPYWREFVHTMANKMDLPIPIMPLLKFKPLKRKKKEEDSPPKESS
jgi:hypothetical protein